VNVLAGAGPPMFVLYTDIRSRLQRKFGEAAVQSHLKRWVDLKGHDFSRADKANETGGL
jgi:hypothetical protein